MVVVFLDDFLFLFLFLAIHFTHLFINFVEDYNDYIDDGDKNYDEDDSDNNNNDNYYTLIIMMMMKNGGGCN